MKSNFTLTRMRLALAAFLFTGCATAPLTYETGADYGNPINDSTARQLATHYLDRTLKDPGSKRVTFDPIAPGNMPKYYRRGYDYGYLLGASVNAKNGFGAYTGATPYYFLFRDGHLTGVWTYIPGYRGNLYPRRVF